MQFCALLALKSDPEGNNKIMKKRLELMCEHLKNLPFKFTFPEGAMYVFARIDHELNMTDLKLVELLLRSWGSGSTWKWIRVKLFQLHKIIYLFRGKENDRRH